MTINSMHKDRLFRLIFGQEEYKENLLSLYNALADKNYENVDDLQINTLDNFIYMSMKNDVSFLISHELTLIEHQSSYNPNMPLRGLLYFSKILEKLIQGNNKIYTDSLVRIPQPRYYVLYNGMDRKLPDRTILRLSDALIRDSEDSDGDQPAVHDFEWTATMLNINIGKNKDLLDKCRPLFEYSTLIQTIRDNKASGLELESAVTNAVDKCIQEGILADLLKAHRTEAIGMLFTEYDEEKVMKDLSEYYKEKGLREGREEGREEGLKEGRVKAYATMVAKGLITYDDAVKEGLDAQLLDQYLAELKSAVS